MNVGGVVMNEKDYDRMLRIKTVGTLQGLNQSVHYNRYEATPYDALDTLFNDYELKKTDGIVDFGCGKGRLAFYVHHRFQVNATGVEMSGSLYMDAFQNLASYNKKTKHISGSIQFECCLAEKYEISPAQNHFYFFNPFSIQIFMNVVGNILQSVEEHQRTVDIVLYYPTDDYIQYIETSTAFELLKEVKIPGLYEQNDNERFMIFRYG